MVDEVNIGRMRRKDDGRGKAEMGEWVEGEEFETQPK